MFYFNALCNSINMPCFYEKAVSALRALNKQVFFDKLEPQPIVPKFYLGIRGRVALATRSGEQSLQVSRCP